MERRRLPPAAKEAKASLKPARGEVWLAELDPVRGHEQAGSRPVLVLSVDPFNSGPAELVIVLPLTSKDRGVSSHVPVQPPEGGLKARSVILCEAIRSISRDRLEKRWGTVAPGTLALVEDRIRILLGL